MYEYAILPHLTYCYLVWNLCTTESDRRKLERIQQRTLGIVFREKSVTYEEILKKAGLTTLYNGRLQDIAIMMHKEKHKLLPSYVVVIFEEHETIYQLRNENDCKIPRF